MKKYFKYFIPFFLVTLVGCGHNVYHKVEGTGLYGRVPLPNGASLVEIAIGDLSITSGILRGGTTIDENTSKGGTFGTVSLGRHTTLRTEPAMNEGNIHSVLTSSNVDEKTKHLVVEYLISRKQLPVPSSAVTSINSAAATGNKNSIPQAIPTKTGIDNAVDKVTEVAPKIVEPIAENTSKVITEVSEDVEHGTSNAINGFWNTIKSIKTLIIIGLGIVILVFLAIYFIKKNNIRETN